MIPTDVTGDRTKLFVYDVASVLTELQGDEYYSVEKALGQTGFDRVFQDPGVGGKQPHHFWAYVTYVFMGKSRAIATLGNLAHETFFASPWWGGLKGRSYQDLALGQEGVNLGVDLFNGNIAIEQVGNYLRSGLEPGGNLVSTWSYSLLGTLNQLAYDCMLDIASIVFPIPDGEYKPFEY